jgi:serine protease Do
MLIKRKQQVVPDRKNNWGTFRKESHSMDNEFNNNQPGEATGGNEYQNNNTTDYNGNQNPVQNYDGSYNKENNNTYGAGNQDTQTIYSSYEQYTGTQQAPTPEKKPKKKSRVFGIFKLTAAAVVFGLVAGATFQGYYIITKPAEVKTEEGQNDSNLTVKEVTEDDQSGDTVVPANISSDEVVTDVSDVVEKVMPSIVAINSSLTTTSYDFFGREYSEQAQGSGSGIIIGQNGSNLLIVTNNHVIDGAQTVEVVFTDETKAAATIKGSDANADLAVLSVDMDDLTKETAAAIKVATLGSSDKVKAGDMAVAIGNALGYGQSVTVGYISAVNREVTLEDKTMTLLQTDAAINPGNSGGALINTQGQVIGINSVKYASEEVEGMGYAIPISSALPMINELMNRETVDESNQGYLGIDASTAQNVTEIYAERFNMPIGVYVNDVIDNSPAKEAGLMKGDIITGVDDTTIKTVDDLVSILSYRQKGQTIDLKIQTKENGAYVEKTLKVTLGARN